MVGEKVRILRAALPKISKPASIGEVEQASGLCRSTCAKWLRILEARQEVRLKTVGNVVMLMEYTPSPAEAD